MSPQKNPAALRHGGPGASEENAKKPPPRRGTNRQGPAEEPPSIAEKMADKLKAADPPASMKGRSDPMHSTDTHKKN